ncbi:alanine racemase [Paenibacillus thalictri]|uniref:Amino acid aldolase n=1 Tax=Paenibacillus thalictri TaxID=2527873 RepID=A0A4Q9DHU4_9BACL|nr:alanine racemase [Paenibacillus thalictri]TBL70759.1 amino acid aldolase [Paenibacillus thalictri]
MPETPCLLIDVPTMNANISAMAEVAKRNRVAWRPHAKTHKIPDIAKAQLMAGASGITVAKISEAEVMAEHGIEDIFVAYPLVVEAKIERAVRLSQRIRLIVGTDSFEGARRLSETAGRHDHVLQVRLEIDTGMKRTGVEYDKAVELALLIHGLPNVRLSGIFTFRGAMLDGKPTLDLEKAGKEEGELMVRLAEAMRAEGIPIADVSVGSTPTGAYAAEVKGVTEIRPGTFVFNDRMQAKFGVCSLDDCAAVIQATVVSRPSERHAVIDGGSKTFATDVQPHTSPLNLVGFGHILEAPDAVLERFSEEHGIIRLEPHHTLAVGDIVHIIPNHVCSTLNLHNYVYLVDGPSIEKVAVQARGMLE